MSEIPNSEKSEFQDNLVKQVESGPLKFLQQQYGISSKLLAVIYNSECALYSNIMRPKSWVARSQKSECMPHVTLKFIKRMYVSCVCVCMCVYTAELIAAYT